jgi:uncharacterized protein YggE
MSDAPIVTVVGEAVLEVPPELAELTIGVEAHGTDRKETLDALSQRANAVAELIARFAAGLERWQTSSLHVRPVLSEHRKEKVRRYVGTCQTSLHVHDFDLVSGLIIAAGEIDLAAVAGPWWQLRAASDAYRQARLAAVTDAVLRARDYAGSVGAEIVRLVEIADENADVRARLAGGGAMFAASLRGGQGSDPEFDLEPAVQQVHGRISARFEISEPDLSRFS